MSNDRATYNELRARHEEVRPLQHLSDAQLTALVITAAHGVLFPAQRPVLNELSFLAILEQAARRVR